MVDQPPVIFRERSQVDLRSAGIQACSDDRIQPILLRSFAELFDTFRPGILVRPVIGEFLLCSDPENKDRINSPAGTRGL